MASSSKLLALGLMLLLASCGEDGGNAPVPGGCNPCRIFGTNSASDGNIGGISGADQRCMTDANYPGDGQFKALMVDGSERRACSSASCSNAGFSEGVDWVLYRNTSYTRNDGTAIGSTNSKAIFDFPLTNAFTSVSRNSYTGLKSDWMVGEHCLQWSANGAEEADVADAGLTTSGAISNQANVQCVSNLYLICVEQ